MNQVRIAILLKELRGSRSQLEMSRALGFKFNQYHKWESGTTSIPFQDFFNVCQLAGVDLAKILASLLHYAKECYDQKELLGQLYKYWYSESEDAFLKASGYSKSKWWRMKSAQVKLTLDEFLDFIDIVARKREPFLKLLSRQFKQKKHLHSSSTDEILLDVIRGTPEFIDIYSCLFLADFRKSRSYFARLELVQRMTRLERDRLEKILSSLKELGILDITRQDLEPPFKLAISKLNIDVHQVVARHCLAKHLRQGTVVKPDGRTGTTSIVAAVSEKAKKEILSRLTECFHEIVKIISADDPRKKNKLSYVYLGAVAQENSLT